MAIKLEDKYAGRVTAANDNYPTGSYKNESNPGVDDGTPLDKDQANDWLGFGEALLKESGVQHSGVPDTVAASDRMNALRKMLGDIRFFETVTDAGNASINANVHKIVITIQRYGASFVRITADEAADSTKYPANTQFQSADGQNWGIEKSDVINVLWLGADPTGQSESNDAFSSALTLGNCFIPPGDYRITMPLSFSGDGKNVFGSGIGSTTIKYYGTGTFLSGNASNCSFSKMTVEDSGQSAEVCIDQEGMRSCVFSDLLIKAVDGATSAWSEAAIKARSNEDTNDLIHYQRVTIEKSSSIGIVFSSGVYGTSSYNLSLIECESPVFISDSKGVDLDLYIEQGNEFGSSVIIAGSEVEGIKIKVSGAGKNPVLSTLGSTKISGLDLNISKWQGTNSDTDFGASNAVQIDSNNGEGGYCYGTVKVGDVRGISNTVVIANGDTANVTVTGSVAYKYQDDSERIPLLSSPVSNGSRVIQNDGSGIKVAIEQGSDLPTDNLVVGQVFFSTSLGKPVWYNGTTWVDSTGMAVPVS